MAAPFVSVINLGCRVNRVESDHISADLARAGFCLVDPEDAQLVIINTCAVTGEAEAKTRKAVRHTLSLPNEPLVNQSRVAWLTCIPMSLPTSRRESPQSLSKVAVDRPRAWSYTSRMMHVFWPAHLKDRPPAILPICLVVRVGASRSRTDATTDAHIALSGKRAVPKRSVPVSAVLKQIDDAVQANIPEVVLTGVNLGAYDAEGREMRTSRSTSCSIALRVRPLCSRFAFLPSSRWTFPKLCLSAWGSRPTV